MEMCVIIIHFLLPPFLKEMAALDHHDLSNAVIFIEVTEIADRIALETLTEGSLA